MKALSPYEIVQVPVYSEKADRLRETQNWYTFRVHPAANKIQIRQAVEQIFGVKVEKVRVIRMKPKPRGRMWRRGRRGSKPAWKKALVKLQAGQKIDILQV
ncbi:50S ribosomal protein L23 [bacterium HR11]|nr:50S ribosomal protein L23 [bacterium HR11]